MVCGLHLGFLEDPELLFSAGSYRLPGGANSGNGFFPLPDAGLGNAWTFSGSLKRGSRVAGKPASASDVEQRGRSSGTLHAGANGPSSLAQNSRPASGAQADGTSPVACRHT